ncbi:hypothetical protein AGIG_G5573 [Arapaima gigas]
MYCFNTEVHVVDCQLPTCFCLKRAVERINASCKEREAVVMRRSLSAAECCTSLWNETSNRRTRCSGSSAFLPETGAVVGSSRCKHVKRTPWVTERSFLLPVCHCHPLCGAVWQTPCPPPHTQT